MAAPTGRISFHEVADGVTISNSNTSPTLTTSTGGTRVASTAEAYATGRGAVLTGTATSSFFAKDLSTAMATCGVGVYHHYLTADIPDAEITFLQIRDSSGGRFSVALQTNGKIRTINAAGSTVDQSAINSNTALTNDKWYYHQISATKGTGTADGTGIYRLYDVTDPNSPILINEITKTNINTGTADYTQLRWGKTGSGGTWTCKIDEISWLEGSTALIDLVNPNTIYEINLSDSLGITDTDDPQTTEVAFLFDDPVGMTDTLEVVRIRVVALVDSIGATDALNGMVSEGEPNSGSYSDIMMAELTAEGYTTGSLSDRRKARYIALLGLSEPVTITLADLEFKYLRSLGHTGSVSDMRRQAGLPNFP